MTAARRVLEALVKEAEDPKATFRQLPREHFTITITWYHWSCGDGCCSDSGYKLKVVDDRSRDVLVDDYDWDSCRDSETRFHQAIEAISERLGRPVTKRDYAVIYDEKYSDQENED